MTESRRKKRSNCREMAGSQEDVFCNSIVTFGIGVSTQDDYYEEELGLHACVGSAQDHHQDCQTGGQGPEREVSEESDFWDESMDAENRDKCLFLCSGH